MNPRRYRIVLACLALYFVFIAGVLPAAADTASYTLNLGNVGGLCGTASSSPYDCSGEAGSIQPPYATVNLVLSSDAKSITVTVSLSGNYVLWGKGATFGFNYIGGAGKLNISGLSSPWYASSGQKMDGMGTFEYAISSHTNQSHGQTLTFTVTRKDGGTFTSANDLFSGTNAYAIDMASCATCSNRVTGYAGGGTPDNPVPEPASILLLGSGLLALWGILSRHGRL